MVQGGRWRVKEIKWITIQKDGSAIVHYSDYTLVKILAEHVKYVEVQGREPECSQHWLC
jgi:hypothetical protein